MTDQPPPASTAPSPARPPGALDGVWLPVKAELSGAPAPDLIITRTELTFRDGAYTVRFDREIADRGTFAFLPAAPADLPHAFLTLTGTRGQNAGRTLPCIYQLAGDRLRICYGLDGRRPDAFATSPEVERYLVTYRRRAD